MKRIKKQIISCLLAGTVTLSAVNAVVGAADIISAEEANTAYKKLSGIRAEYRYFKNREYKSDTNEWKTEEFILPVYIPEAVGRNEIDAITGEYTTFYEDIEKYGGTYSSWDDVLQEDVVLDSGCGFDDTELPDGLEKLFISDERALKLIKKDKYIVFDDGLMLSSRHVIGYDNGKGETVYKLELTYTGVSDDGTDITLTVYMDPFSGEILSFTKNYGCDYYSGQNIAIKSARETAVEAVKYYLGDKAAEYELFVPDNYAIQPSGHMCLTFYRKVNGLDAKFDKVDVTVDHNNEVTSFGYTYHDMDFPEPDLIPEDMAYDMLFEEMFPAFTYKSFTDSQMKTHTYLTYVYDEYFIINGLTGERINDNGKPYYSGIRS